MALFDRKKSPLVRLKGLEWNTDDERRELFREIGNLPDLKFKDIAWTLTAPEPELRQLGVTLLPRFSGPGLANALLAELEGKSEQQQRFLIRHISRCDPADVKDIASKLLADLDKRRRNMGIELVNALPAAQAAGLVKDLLKDPSAEVRLVGLNKLLEDPATMADPNLRAAVIAMGSDADERLRHAVLKAIMASPTRTPEMEALLVKTMKDESITLQTMATQVLSERTRRGDPELEAALIELLSDGNTSVRTAVIKALLGSPDRRRVIRKYLAHARTLAGWVRDRALESLKAFSADLVDPIIELMQDEDEEIRLLALGVGGNFEDPRCVDPIIRLLQGGDWWTRVTAAETLGRIGDKRAVPALLKMLDDEDARWAGIEALAHIKDPGSVPALVRCLKDPASEIRAATLDALASFGPRPEIISAIEELARTDETRSVRDRAMELVRKLEAERGSGRDLGKLEAAARQTNPMGDVNELEKLLIEVRNAGGSDLHISVGVPPTMRIHGELKKFDLPIVTEARARELLIMVLNERQQEQMRDRLQVDFCYSIPNVGRYRANVFVQRLGWGGVFRVIPGIVPTLADIGMPSHMNDLINYHQGVIVVAGPAGSGKSTTLAALINLYNENKRAHILTIEDPVEFVHPMKNSLVNQRELGKHTQSYANALKGALREDPDVIVVGEMRDNETMKMALEAGETGHLVIATLNTTTAPKTVDRLIESFPPSEQGKVRMALSESLKAVICQNLLPRSDGKGRVALFEILLGNSNVRTLIRDNKTFQLFSAMQVGRNHGMRTVDMSLMDLVQQGAITPEDAWMRAKDKATFEPLCSSSFLREAMGDMEPDDSKKEGKDAQNQAKPGAPAATRPAASPQR